MATKHQNHKTRSFSFRGKCVCVVLGVRTRINRTSVTSQRKRDNLMLGEATGTAGTLSLFLLARASNNSMSTAQYQQGSTMNKKRPSLLRRVSSSMMFDRSRESGSDPSMVDASWEVSDQLTLLSSHVSSSSSSSSNNDDDDNGGMNQKSVNESRKRHKAYHIADVVVDSTNRNCDCAMDSSTLPPTRTNLINGPITICDDSMDTSMDTTITMTSPVVRSTMMSRTTPLHAITPVSSQVTLSSDTVSVTTTVPIRQDHHHIHTVSSPTIWNDVPLLHRTTERHEVLLLKISQPIGGDVYIGNDDERHPVLSSVPSVRDVKHPLHHPSWFVVMTFMAFAMVRLLLYPPSNILWTVTPQNHPNTVCVSGGGFSGFWFTLGRLQNSIILPTTTTTTDSVVSPTNPNDIHFHHTTNSTSTSRRKEYYCYSSGCLGVVAALSRYSMEDMWNIAYNIQLEWKSGQLDRYDVVTTFVDDLLFGRQHHPKSIQPSMLQRNTTLRLTPMDVSSLNIITTVKNGWWGVKTSIRTPQSVHELRTMLIQTTWIPFAIGNDLWYNNHMDGAFTTLYHPTCQYNVGLAFDWDLYTNVVNVNLGRDKVEQFWNKGLEYGL